MSQENKTFLHARKLVCSVGRRPFVRTENKSKDNHDPVSPKRTEK